MAKTDETDQSKDSCREICSMGLGFSRALALNRLYNLERRLNKDPELYTAYHDFMNEYMELGHVKLATRVGKYFILHHAVVKRHAQGIKIRVVFDASALTSTGRSLNDCLVPGPKLQTDISDILLRTRFKKYLVIADIAKMYRQIQIQTDRVYQHILWRNSPHEEVKEYELCTVTYGINAALFLAIRCLRQLDEDNGPEYPLAQHLLVTNTYIDDIIAGADSVEHLLDLQTQLIALLHQGCFELKKWANNCKEALETIAPEDHATDPYFEPDGGQTVKLLGIYWDSKEDTFGYRSAISDERPTKRSILSVVARLYDPIGALGPSIFWAKCVMQEIWCQKLNWDTLVSTEISNKWKIFITDLPYLTRLKIYRYIDITQIKDVQLLGFSDASQKGYAAMIYLRVVNHRDLVRIHFLTCKTKVAPLKSSQVDSSLTIPRMELCAAVLLARLLAHKLEVLQEIVPISHVRAFVDSTIVLSWLASEPKDFKIFVINRISKIKEVLPQCEWFHVRSKVNAADPASRGLLPQELVACKLHQKGPEFLCRPEGQWPASIETSVPADQLPEFKNNVQCMLGVQVDYDPEEVLQRFSTLLKMQRILVYCFRYINILRKRTCDKGIMTHEEMDHALFVAIRITQDVYWSQLQKQLKNTSKLITPSTLAQLAPFLDEDGLIRIGGRLRHSALGEAAKHPVLLPKKSHLTQLIIRHYHLSLLHAGPKLVMSMIVRRFWIVSAALLYDKQSIHVYHVFGIERRVLSRSWQTCQQ